MTAISQKAAIGQGSEWWVVSSEWAREAWGVKREREWFIVLASYLPGEGGILFNAVQRLAASGKDRIRAAGPKSFRFRYCWNNITAGLMSFEK